MFGKLPPIVSGSLPAPQQASAPSLGHAFLRCPPISSFSNPSPVYKSTSQPALEIKEVGYSVFYPCDEERKKGSKNRVSWVPEPEKGIMDGYEKFVGKSGLSWMLKVLGAAVGRISFPAHPLVPLAPKTDKYPLVIFSHGLAGTRNTYSQYCASLAAAGNVVLAVEHRDGSGPAVLNPSRDGVDKSGETMLYLSVDELSEENGTNPSKDRLRALQLAMRVREVYETYHSFSRLVGGQSDGKTIYNNGKAEDQKVTDFVNSLQGQIDLDNVYLTGHSFGGGTMLHLLQTPPPEDPALTAIPAKRCVALDPWIEPLPTPTPSPQDKPLPRVPILCINSPGFTEWPTHFHRLRDMVKKVDGSFVSLLGSSHQSFSDFPLLYPGSTALAMSLLSTTHELSNAFIHGRLSASPIIEGKKPDQGDFERTPEGKVAGKKAEVVVHLLGQGA